MNLSPERLARMIDVSAVQAHHDVSDVDELAQISREHGFIAAHVLPTFVPRLAERLDGSQTLVGAPVGFPAGGSTTEVKICEAQGLAAAGVREMDLMISLGRLRSGDRSYVSQEIRRVVAAVAPVPVKVILEIGHLGDDLIKAACEMCIEAQAAYVKTSTGWGPPAATLSRVRMITEFVHGAILVKASGGIRDLQTVKTMMDLGVSRFGINTRAAVALLQACAAATPPTLSV